MGIMARERKGEVFATDERSEYLIHPFFIRLITISQLLHRQRHHDCASWPPRLSYGPNYTPCKEYMHSKVSHPGDIDVNALALTIWVRFRTDQVDVIWRA
jgi:hypothetical protein